MGSSLGRGKVSRVELGYLEYNRMLIDAYLGSALAEGNEEVSRVLHTAPGCHPEQREESSPIQQDSSLCSE